MDKDFTWNDRKNEWLKENRGISFEEVIEAIGHRLLDVRVNKSQQHKKQRIFIVEINNYPWVVPFEETDEEIFLITAFPERRLKKEFWI